MKLLDIFGFGTIS